MPNRCGATAMTGHKLEITFHADGTPLARRLKGRDAGAQDAFGMEAEMLRAGAACLPSLLA